MPTVAGLDVENLTNWSDPFQHDGTLLRVGRVSPLYRLWNLRHPRALRAAGVFYRKEKAWEFLVQYLDAPPAPVQERPVVLLPGHESVRVNEAGLLSWQPDALRRLKWHWLRGARNLADLSDTGVGKTYVFLALCRELRRHAYVVTLKNAALQWAEAAEAMGVPCTVTHYENLKTGKNPALKWELVKGDEWPRWQIKGNKVLVAFDEAQKCRSPDYTLNSKLLLRAAYQRIPHVLLSATLATSPVYMRASGYSLGLHGNADFETWLDKNACIRAGGKWLFSNDRSVMRDIHERLMNSCAVRIRKADLGDRFPPTVIEPWLMEFPAEVEKVFAVLAEKLRAYREKSANFSEGFGATQAERMQVEFLKIPALVQMAQDWIEEGLKVVAFFNFDEPLREFCRLMGDCPSITGDQTQAERHKVQKEFQADLLDCIGANSESGGAAISLHGKAERGALILPTWKADTLRQVFGRLPRAGGNRSIQRVIFAAGTIEEEICRNLRAKLNNLDTLNDGDTTGNLHFMRGRIKNL